jgi:hypothetical protein
MSIFYPITEIVKMQEFAPIVEKADYRAADLKDD